MGYYVGNENIYGKTVIITGCNTGIGKETAKVLAKKGGRIIMACRDLEKAKAARDEVVAYSGSENIIIKHVDLSSLKSIRDFAANINSTEPSVNILINNAGVMHCPKMTTNDGFEMQFGVNHLGHFLLTLLLLDKMKEKAPSRIINISSLAHLRGRIDFDDLNSSKVYSSFSAYSQSKLANILFTFHLAKLLKGTGVTVNALHPGVVDTDLSRHWFIMRNRFLRFLITPIRLMISKTPIQGAQTTIFCALSSDLEDVTGKYFSDCKEAVTSKRAQDENAAERLFDISKKLTGLE